MADFINNLTSPSWWVSVVIIGIIINLVSEYIKPSLDNIFSKVSTRWRERTDKSRAARLERINELAENPQEQVLTSLNNLREAVESVIAIVIGAILFAVGISLSYFGKGNEYVIVFYAIGAIEFLFGVISYISIDFMIIEASRKIKK